MTRSKAWLRVLGYGEDMRGLLQEFQRVKQENFVLKFNYPTEEERRTMNLVNRDMSPTERLRIANQQKKINEFLEALDKGEIHKEDLPQEVLDRLRDKLL